MSVDDAKIRLREQALTLRRNLDDVAKAKAAYRLKANFVAAMDEMAFTKSASENAAVVAGYWPMGSEINVQPLLCYLDELGFDCALPVVMGSASALEFRRWRPGMILDRDVYGVHHPDIDAERLTPKVILCPLLAFDNKGYRLGRGGGHYDRTLKALRAMATPPLVVGIAFAVQCVGAVPYDDYDQRLDWLVSDETALKMSLVS